LLDQGNAAKAIDALKPLDENYQDTAQLMAQARAQLNARAETFYRQGVKHFLNEELEQAIDSWEKALAINPEHPKAKLDMDNALRLLDRWRGLEKSDEKVGK
ncbi:MAG: tetratricopeptide repeat protein, partial [Desulfatitalea sp.]|nr:tetratricopeptide repeat protein [Desulfatitalea sp.]